jgi:hypothetical protein
MGESDCSRVGCQAHFPHLLGWIELDLAGAVNVQYTQFLKWHSFGPEAAGCAVRGEGDDVMCCVHGFFMVLKLCKISFTELR